MAKAPLTKRLDAALRRLRYESRHPGEVMARWAARARAELLGRRLAVRAPGNVMMLHMGRSGSKVLGNLLERQRGLHWDWEIYPHAERRGRQGELIEYLRARMYLGAGGWYASETTFGQLDMAGVALGDFVDALPGLGFNRYIVLERRNHLRVLVSYLVARRFAVWHYRNREAPRLTRLHIDCERLVVGAAPPASLVDYMHKFRGRFQLLRERLPAAQRLDLNYEDDIEADPRRAYERVCRFLALQPLEIDVRLSRTTPFALEQLVDNLDEVRAALAGTEFEWMAWEERA